MAVDVGKFIRAPEYDIKIITHRDVFQASICEEDRTGDACRDSSALIVIDTDQLKKMGIKPDSNVLLTSKWGRVVVKAIASPRSEQKGVGFMVNSPWSNALVSDTAVDGIPEYKNIDAKIRVAKEGITSIQELIGL